MSSDTLLVGGTDIQSADRIIQMWDDSIASRVKRGSNIVIPYTAGELFVEKVVDARDFTVGMLVKGANRAAVNTNIDALYAILPDLTSATTTVVLTLRRYLTAGVVDKTCTAEYLGGVAPQFAGLRVARLTLRFRLLSGSWT